MLQVDEADDDFPAHRDHVKAALLQTGGFLLLFFPIHFNTL